MTDTTTELSPDEQSRFDTLYGTGATEGAPAKPGIFAGAYKGPTGLLAGAAGAALSTASFASNAQSVLGEGYAPSIGLLGDHEKLPWNAPYQSVEKLRQDTAEYYRPDPQTTGFVGNTLYGVTDVLARVGVGQALAPGVGGLAVAAGTTGYERTTDLENQGVDGVTATASGALAAGSVAAGGVAGSYGPTIATRVLSGAGVNVALGSGGRALDSVILRKGGYDDMAEQAKWSDASAIAADIVIGGAFGFLPHGREAPQEVASTPRHAADTVDAALAAKAATQTTEAAPGVPADPLSSSAHVNALDTAQGQLMEGQTVSIEPIVQNAKFVNRFDPAEAEHAPTVAGEVRDALVADGVPNETLAEASGEPTGTTLLTADAPATEEGFTRLYRGEHANQDRGVFITDDVNDGKVGGWFTTDQAYAESYKNTQEQGRRGPGKDGRIVYVDVPNDKLADYAVENSGLGKNVIRQGENSHFIPSLRRESVIEPAVPRRSNESIAKDFSQRLTDHEDALRAYAERPDSDGGKVLNTDIARELSDDYLSDRTRSAAVHEPASAFIKRVYAEKLAEKPVDDGVHDGSVMFTAGGTGAGKTTSLTASPAAAEAYRRADIVYDTNMNKFDSADQKVKQALDAGRPVKIVYTYRDPADALVNGALPRAERQAKEFGTGRTVPLAEHVKTHLGAYDVMQRLNEKYKDEPNFEIIAVDNSFGRGGAIERQLAELPPIGADIHGDLLSKLQQEYTQGRISRDTYRGFMEGETNDRVTARSDRAPEDGARNGNDAGNDAGAEGGKGRVGEGHGPSVRGGAESRGDGARREGQGRSDGNEGLDPSQVQQVDIARQAAAENPNITVDGVRASEAMAAADAEVEQAARQSQGLLAAVSCFLRFGEDAA